MVILKQKNIRYLLLVSVIIVIFAFGLIYFNFNNLSSPLIMHFDSLRGVDLFGNKADLVTLSFSIVLMLIINAILANVSFDRERVLSYLLVGVNVLVAILFLVASAVIVSVN